MDQRRTCRRLACRAGVTLVEAMVATTLTMMIGSAVMLSLSAAMTSAEYGQQRAIAQGIADQLLDEIAGSRYHASNSGPLVWPLGVEAGEGSNRASCDDIDDFAGYTAAVVDPYGQPLGRDQGNGSLRPTSFHCAEHWLASWSVAVSVYYVDESNPQLRLNSGQTSYLKAVEVRVLANRPNGGTQTLAQARRLFAYAPPGP